MFRPATIFVVVLLFGCPLSVPDRAVFGQPPSDDAAAETGGGDVQSPTGISLTVTPSSIGRNVPGRWSTASVNGSNGSDQDAEETTAVMVGDDSNLQFARRVWVPAGARRQSWLPLLIPSDLDPARIQVEMRSILLAESEDGAEQLKSNYLGMSTSQRSLLLSWEDSRTALLIDPLDASAAYEPSRVEINQMLYAGRDSAGIGAQDLGMIRIGSSFLPPTGRSLDPIDQIVIADDRILTDTTAVTMIRGWLQQGGRIWFMVDQISPESVQAILGEPAPYSMIDRVELNEFEFEQTDVIASGSGIQESWSSERPTELVRVLTDLTDVQRRVNGWPVEFWQPFGQGEVLYTTLGARGWNENGDGPPTLALQSLSQRFFVSRIAPPKHTEQLISFLNDEIGYEIPDRSTVGSVLGIHMLIVLLAGGWLAYRKQLHHLALVVPVAAIVATGILFAIGKNKTSAVPSTIATSEIVRLVGASSQARVESVAAVYSQEARPLSIESSYSTTTWVGDSTDSGEVRRILWTDDGTSRWLFITQPPGAISQVVSESMITMPSPWTVRGSFTPTGFTGRIGGIDASECEDMVIVTAAAPPASVDVGGAPEVFNSGIENVMSGDQFIDEALMSDTQQDRQDLLRQLITPESPLIGRQPSLLLWTNPINAGVTFDENYVRRGSTLASIPIQLGRLASGSEFLVPASFIRMESYTGIRGTSTIYNPQTGRWLDEMNKPNESELLCLVPKVLLPCELTRATIQIKMSAPSRTVWIRGLVDGELVTVDQRANPTGIMQFEITDPEALKLTSEGGLVVGLAVSESDEARPSAGDEDDPEKRDDAPNRSTWGIDFMHVNLEGKTQ